MLCNIVLSHQSLFNMKSETSQLFLLHGGLPPGKLGEQFYWALGDLKFPATSRGWDLDQMEDLKFPTLLGVVQKTTCVKVCMLIPS